MAGIEPVTPLLNYIRRWMRNPVFRSIVLLLSGTGLAQLIPVGIQLFLARLYSQTDFGELSVFSSVLGIGGVAATLNYEFVIVMSRRQGEARTMVFLSLLSSLFVSLLCLGVLYWFKPSLSALLHISEYSVLWLVPPTILMMGWMNTFTNWYNRKRAYRMMAKGQIAQGLSISILKLSFGCIGLSSGLIWGTCAGYIFALAFFLYFYLSEEYRYGLCRTFSWARIRKYAWEYRDFAVYASIGNLFNSFSLIGLPLLIAFYYPLEIAGLYFFASSVIRMPVNLLFGAISKVYKREASEMYQRRPHALYSFTLRIQKMTLYFVLPLLVFFSLFGEPVFSFLFGGQWGESGEMIRYFAVLILFNALYSPISSVADILRHQKLLLFFNVSIVISQVVVFAIGAGFPFKYVLLATSCVGAIHYMLLNAYMMRRLKSFRS